VAPAELEDLLLSHKGIRDCAVIGIADRNSGEIPKAFVVKALDATDLTERDVKEFIRCK
jgi:acyl-coenzyme A synthetase/AMP-(fatty) acid ligase